MGKSKHAQGLANFIFSRWMLCESPPHMLSREKRKQNRAVPDAVPKSSLAAKSAGTKAQFPATDK